MDQKREHHSTTQDHRCLQSLIEVFLFIDGQLDEERAGEIEDHLETCQACYGRVNFEKMVKTYVKKRVAEDRPSNDMVESISKMLEA